MSSNGLPHTVYIYCADTLQYSFASHLSLAFHRKGIYASVNCNETLDKIEEASGFVVVLSKNYLSSPSCLDKLVKALQCRRKHVQLVVPVFYGLSPSDVAVQEQESDDRIRDWISALQELRDLPGILSREESSDCELVKEIVKDVYEKLFPTQQIGVNSRLLEIKQLLCKQPWGIRHIGIWGMPGIGKTTLAKAFFDQLSGRYEASCFITHFDKAFHEKGLYRLWDEHFGKILKDIPGVCSSITRPSLPGEKINKKRTLIVLDDVQNPLVAESFLRGFHWFGPGSLIIVTSRDKRVFRLCQISQVYEVKRLNKNEALQLYSQCAFGKDIEEQKLMELPMEVIDYANGNPLALSFYGEELKGKNLLEPNMIHDLLKSSYETLSDDEKDIFLDIACFFQGDEVDYVKQLLEGCGLFPHVGIDVLVEKCLVTISENRVEMHGIIKDYGREINNKETTWIKRGRRLWGASTIEFLLQDENLEAKGHPEATCKGALVSISLDTTNFRFDLNPTAFENMLNLRFLKIYSCNDKSISGVHLPKGLESLPNELRLLHWENYPLQSLPQDFDPGHLVELNMPYSQLQTLWRGTKKLDMLKIARLSHSQQLTEIDDICKAQNIELIDLQGCEKLQSFPATDQLQHLRVVNLSGCSEIRSFPELSPNIEDINLQGTAIRELQISIGDATNLKKLYLSGCSSLVQLPSSIGNASNLQILDLSFCSSLLPSSLGIAANLKKLYLSGCSSLMQLPSSIGNAPNLQILDLSNCSSLIELPSSIGDATKLKKLCLRGSSGLVQLPSSIGNAINLQELDLEYCSSLVEIPSSFENATHLKKLYLTGCSSLSPVEEESVYGASASHSWTSDSSRLGEKGKQCFDEIEEENEEEEGSSSQEANEPVSLEEEERLRQELEEIEAKYREEMKEIERKREEALMETKKKLSLVKKTKS
ncbi:BnaC03g62030D [Brassica napus]|uniref:BnaC03g62030D protein n=1 Tax=Brassica napus TaxID=3708 RepID=A0A078HCE6_BRANA|nr:BnaC03g62030D [Brassica napus]